MTDNQLVMVTEWMVNGNVNVFVNANKDADRSGLVRLPPEVVLFYFLLTTARTPAVGRCRQGLGLFTQPGYGPRGSKGSTPLHSSIALPVARLLDSRLTS